MFGKMTAKKERKWSVTEECKSVSSIPTSKPNQKSWRSCRVPLDDSKPVIKPPRKILRLGQNDADLNQRSTSGNNKPKIENIIWNVRNTCKPNSCDPAPCSAVLREDVQKEIVLPSKKQEQDDDEKFIKKNSGLKLNRTCTEVSKKIDEMGANLVVDVRKVVSKSCDDRKFDNFKNKSYSLSPERGSISSNDSQNLKRQYSPLVSSPFLKNNELKSDQSDNILRALVTNQTTDENSKIGNKINSERSEDISLHPTLRKSENESFNKSKNMADHFLSKSDSSRETECETFDCEKTADHNQSRGFNLNVSLDSENIRTHPELSKSNQNDVCEDNQPTKSQNLSANFGALTDEDLEDFVENLKRFLQTKIVSPQYMQSEVANNLDDSNVHGFDCHCLECGKVEVDESNKILECLCSHFKKNTGEKTSLIDPMSFNEISVIATVRVVDSACDINNGKEQSLEQYFKEKCEDNDQQNKDSVLTFKETTLLKSNVEKSNFIQTNPTEYKDNGDLTTMPSLVCDKNLIKSFNQWENKPTNSSVVCRGNFSEFVIPLKREINHSLLSKYILQMFNLKMLPGYFKGTNSLVPLKLFNVQQDELKTISNFIIAHFISKYCANFILSTRNWFSFQTERKVLHNQFVSDSNILTQGLNKNRCKKIKPPTEKETELEVDPVDYFEKLLIKNKDSCMHKNDYSTSSNDLCLSRNNNDNSTEKTLKLKNMTPLSITNCQQNKNVASFQETNLYLLPKFISKSQPHEKEIKALGKEKYIKNDVFDTTDNHSEVEDYFDQTSLYEKTLIKEKTYKPFPSKTISNNSKTTAFQYLTLNHDPEVYDYFPDNILSTEKISPATILTTEEASISIIPKNEPIQREPFDFDSPDFKNSAPSLKEKHVIDPSSEGGNLSTCSTPQTPVEMQDSDDELNGLVSTESLHHIINDGFLSEMEADVDIFSQDWDIFLQETSTESLSAKDEATNDCISKLVNIDSPVSSGRLSQDDSDNNFQSVSSSEEKEKNIFSSKQAPSDFADETTSKIKDLDHLLEITDFGSSLDDQNDDDDDDSDSVLSLYAPSSASFLDENEANNSDNRSVENLSFEEEREAKKTEQVPAKTECGVNSNMEDEILGIEVENVEAQTLDDMKEDFILDNKLSPSHTNQQELKTQEEFEESSTVTIQIEDLPVPIGFCYQFVKKGQCSKLSACHFKHENPSKEEFLSFSFCEECKNGKLNKAFDLFALLKDLNSDSPEKAGLLLRSCLSQSNSDMTFLLIPDLICHKMLTPKIVHDIFTICASCPFKYEEKLWKLYETMMLLKLRPSLNSIMILLQMYFEMLNWHKIWQILLNTILIEPLSVIPTAICHGALTFVINDTSCQYLLQAVDWICISAVDDLWNIEPCLLYHLSVLFKTKCHSNASWILHEHLQQINTFPEEIDFTEKIDEPQTNAEYISCLQNIQEIQANKNWLQLSDIFIFIYESSQLNSSWFIQPIVEAFLKIDNFSMMTTVFNDFLSSTCSQLNNLVKENSSYPVSGCRKHLVRMITDLISFCYSNKMWAEGSRIVSVFLKNELEFDLKDHLNSIPHDSLLFALDICLHSKDPLKAISLLEGLGWFCQLPPVQFINNLHLKQWLKKILQVLIEQLSSLDKLPNGCRVFSLFVSIIQEFPCINHADLMNVSNKFILQCLTSENVDSAIYAYNMIKSLLPQINPRCCNVAIFRALLVASHLGPRIPPCVRELYNFCARHLEAYPPQKLIQPPWTLEIASHLTDIEMHLVMEDFLDYLYNILCDQSIAGQQMTLDDLHLCVMVRNAIVTDVFPNICYLRNVPMNRMEVLQQALFVLHTYVAPPLEAKINNCQTGLLVNPESLKHFIFVKDSQRRNQGLQFHPVPNKKLKPRFRGKGRFR